MQKLLFNFLGNAMYANVFTIIYLVCIFCIIFVFCIVLFCITIMYLFCNAMYLLM